ncbi:diguanylate cyclase [Acinetobacter sp. ANC 4277]|uniref:sensor domain-containing diguanylate cyclase n=1 Tax=Acinetobacter terrae TaxID=2731247 RepID=UPI00148F9D2E|nr:GGDEF domain-containing protein [Acinetobacter terrae]NNG75997.1 diguanylate cyclase [Acinetobacter terrae]
MFRFVLSAIFSVCLFLLSTTVYASTPLNFDRHHNARLDGVWNYYPNQLIIGSEASQISPSKIIKTVQLPASFLSISGQKDGLATFQQHFKLPESAVGQQIYLYIPYQYGAYQLFVDDRLLTKVGQVGVEEHHQTEMAPKLVSFFPNKTDVVITIQVSSFQHIRGGLENSIFIGFNKPILYKFYRQVIPLTIVSGVLLMIGCFMVLFALYRIAQRQSSHIWLFLGLFILCLSLRSFFAVPFIYTLFTNISWLWGTRLEYLLTELVCLFFLLYIFLLPHQLIHRFLLQVICVMIGINILVTLSQQPLVFQSFFFQSFAISFLIFANLLYAVYRIYRDQIPYSKANAFAIVLVCLTFIHDYLLGLKLIDSVEIAFYTSCIYFMVVTLQLSRDYAVQSYKTELLNKKLLQWNKTLDKKVRERTQAITQLNEQLAHQVRTDALTGAYNRYALNIEIQQRFEQAIQAGSSLGFYMIDVDYFKKYNDHYGHLKGDDILKALVKTIDSILPASGFLARYGGEEFAILLSDLNREQTQKFAEKLCRVIREQQLEHINREDGKDFITISVGVAIMDSVHIYKSVDCLMKTADQQLYQAKIQRDQASIQ